MNEKENQLGMAWSTAVARLSRILLFSLAQKSKMDTCFRCSKPIETLKEFTIEHKDSWFNVSAELFWDLNNIAFSHKFCNTQAVSKGKKLSAKHRQNIANSGKGKVISQAQRDKISQGVIDFYKNKKENNERVS